MSLSYETPEYLLDFQCLGSDCEDTCCQHWDIRLDKHHYRLLENLMQEDPQEQKLFQQYIQINDQAVTGDHDYACISMNQAGQCPMLTEDGLCNIQRRYGQQPLGNICAFFPRVISRCEQRIEMSGAMSCPEVVRRCLRSSGPLRYVRFQPSTLPRKRDYPIQRELPASKTDHYAQHFRQVRKAFLCIMEKHAFALDTRLFAVINLAHRLSENYHRDCGAQNEMQMQQVLYSSQQATKLEKLAEYLLTYENNEPLGIVVVHSILQIKQHSSPKENTSLLANQILQSYLDELQSQGKRVSTEDIQIKDFYHLFCQRNELCRQTFATELDNYLARYLENCIYREWFFTMPDTFTYMQMLLLRCAMLRYLIVSHPDMVQLAQRCVENTIAQEESHLAMQQLVVSVVYNFARAIDQNMAFLQVIYNALGEQQMMNYDFSLAFIKL